MGQTPSKHSVGINRFTSFVTCADKKGDRLPLPNCNQRNHWMRDRHGLQGVRQKGDPVETWVEVVRVLSICTQQWRRWDRRETRLLLSLPCTALHTGPQPSGRHQPWSTCQGTGWEVPREAGITQCPRHPLHLLLTPSLEAAAGSPASPVASLQEHRRQ